MEREFSAVKIWVNGTFDVFHPGHLALLKYASSFGRVYVGLDHDHRIKEKKGPSRPIFNFEQRKEMLESLKFVEEVYGFGSDEELIDIMIRVEPEIMVIGSDYKGKPIVGSHIPQKIVFFDRIGGISTTEILRYEDNSSRGKMY